MGKQLTINAFTLSGTPIKPSWAQAHVFENQSEGVNKGKVFVAISLSGPDDFDARLTGRKALSAFEESFNYSKDGAYVALNESLVKVYNLFSSFAMDTSSLFFDFVAGVFVDNVMYVGLLGYGGAKLYREGKVINLYKKEPPFREPSVVSGYMRKGDSCLLYTSSFMVDLSEGDLLENLNGFGLQEVSDRLAPLVTGGEKASTKALVIVGVDEEEKEEDVVSNDEVSLETVQEELRGEAETETETVEAVEKVQEQGKSPLNRVGSLFGGLKRVLSGGVKRVSEPVIFLGDRERRFYRTKKMSLTIGLVLLVLLGGSLILGMRKKDDDKFEKAFISGFSEAKDKYDEGFSLLELNPALAKSPLGEAKTKVDALLSMVGERKEEKQQILDLSKKIDEALTGSSRTYKISDPTLYYDLAILKDKVNGDEISVFDKNVLVFDKQNKNAFVIGLSGKSGEVIAAGSDLDGVNFGAMGDSKAYFYKKDSGVYEAKSRERGFALGVKKDDEWGEIGDMAAFGSNLYLLDKTNGKIWKYVASDSGFSSKSNYIVSGTAPDLSKATRLEIDGYVWVLLNDGTMLRYVSGRLDPISLSGAPENLGEISSLFVGESGKNLYILDKVKKMVVVFDKKSGVYNSQYQWEGMKDVSGIAVDEESKKIYLLSGSKIFSIDLK